MPGTLCQTDSFPKQMWQVAKYLQWSLTQFWWTIHLRRGVWDVWRPSNSYARLPQAFPSILAYPTSKVMQLNCSSLLQTLSGYPASGKSILFDSMTPIRSQVKNQKLHWKKNWLPKKTYAICPEADLPWTYPQPLAEDPKLELLIGCKRHARNLQRLKPKNTK